MLKQREITRPIIIFLLSTILIIVLSLVSASGLPNGMKGGLYSASSYDAEWQQVGYPSLWYRWDTVWYTQIAEDGYSYTEGELSSISFFPAFPFLIGILSIIMPNPLIAAMFISILAYLLSLIFLYQVTLLVTENHEISSRAVFMLAFFPGALFLFAPYTESLFLLLSLLVVHETLKKRYWSAGIIGAFASGLRIPGVLLMVFVLIEWFNAWKNEEASKRDLLPIVLMPGGLIAYLGYLWIEYGDPLIFIRSTSNNTTDLNAGPLSAFSRELQYMLAGSEHYVFTLPMGILALILAGALIYPVWQKIGLSYAAYMSLSVLLPFWGGPIHAMLRFITVLFPVFIMLAIWGQQYKRLNLIYAIISLNLLSIYVLIYIRGFFLG